MTAAPPSLFRALTRRVVQSEDTPFLQRLYAASRTDEMAFFPWSEAQKQAFLQQQFAARSAHYHAQFPEMVEEVLLLNDGLVGSIAVRRRPDEIHLVDIALLPEHHNRGLGTHLLEALIAEAETARLPLRLHVDVRNPACRLYARLGFRPISRDSFYTHMEYRPTGIDILPTISYT